MTSANTGHTKTAILDTAQDLIQRLGVNGMSYRDISDIVGIRKASIHYYFPSKNDLVVALLDRYIADFFELVDRVGDSSEPADVKLRRYCGLFEATLDSQAGDKLCLCGMVGAELKSLPPAGVERVMSFYRENHRRLAALLAEGRATKVFHFVGSVETMATLTFSMLEGGMMIARAEGGMSAYQATIGQLMLLLNDEQNKILA